ncbi:MAG: protein translocase subunit SecF [Ignavibacteriales bacterium]|nr:protein translocase subunit SecF [Ignavibacteriales bacterium]
MRLFKKTNIDFMGIRGKMYILSSTIILLGMISLFVKGVNYGIDFRGGTELVLSFNATPDYGVLRSALMKAGLPDCEIKSFGSDQTILIRTSKQEEGLAVANRIKESIQTDLSNLKFSVLRQDKIGPKVGKELRTSAIYSVLATLAVILCYIAIRYKFIYGFGAVLSLYHDVLLTLGIISVLDGVIPHLNLEITQEIIAAFLTLIGLSVNDTVVVFDRIRENSKIYRSLSLGEVMNRSLNDTLSRTIITSGTILVALLVLLFVGGEVTRGFAFTLTIGIITGTYSSIYIASAIVLDYTLSRKKSQ